MPSVRLTLAAASCVSLSAPVLAQDAAPAAPADDFHGENVIVVTAGGLQRLDMLAGTSVLEGERLDRNLDGQIGEVLTKVPGVSATSFSPGASRPVLRGFSGDRVRVLVDGIGSIDASNTSADHAVTIDPLTADRIEVLRGPAVLLYGSSAIGGAVNVLDRRIPRGVPDEPVHFDALASLDSAYDLREGGASADLPLGGEVALHFDGSWRATDDVATPLGVLTDSATETLSLGSGIAWIGHGASLGVSGGYYDSVYGVPARPGSAEDDVSISLEQKRADLRGSLGLGGLFEELTTRWGYSDYTHSELEGDEVGTTFLVEGVEGRAELIQRPRGGWHGSLGVQYLFRDFSALGDEAFVPPNRTQSFALFTLQELDFDPFELEFGGRFESTRHAADTLGLARRFDTWSAALGFAYSPAPGVRLGLNASRAARAPSAEELFADGSHVATRQFEIGDPELTQERALGLEAYARASFGGADFGFNVSRSWFDDFVYLQATGATVDDLPVFRQLQQGADHFGVEAEASLPLLRAGGFRWIGEVQGDYVRATLADGTAVPRIPPLSLLGALELQSDALDLRGEIQWFARQDRTAPLETPTGAFAEVNLSAAWKPLRGDSNLTVLLQANNLFDAIGRRHASFTKDYVPLAGRNVKLSVRLSL